MNLYIKILDGQPVEHPVTEENLLMAFPDFDINNLPDGWAKFNRLECKVFRGTFQKLLNNYVLNEDGVTWQDNWYVEDMTDDEKANLIAKTQSAGCPHPSWTLDTTTLIWSAPIPYPDDGKQYVWDDTSETWILFTPPENP